MAWHEFLAELEHAADDILFAPQSTDAPIQIAGPAESAGLTADALWFLGADEESWPAVGSMHPFLPPYVQRELAYAPRVSSNWTGNSPRPLLSACSFQHPKSTSALLCKRMMWSPAPRASSCNYRFSAPIDGEPASATSRFAHHRSDRRFEHDSLHRGASQRWSEPFYLRNPNALSRPLQQRASTPETGMPRRPASAQSSAGNSCMRCFIPSGRATVQELRIAMSSSR